MMDRWRSWRLWVAVTVLAIVGVGATILKVFGWDWPWLVATLAAVTAVFALPAKLWTSRIEGAAKRSDERAVTLRAGTLGGGRRRVRDYADPTELGVHRAVLPERVSAAADLPAQVPVYVPRDHHEQIVELLAPGTFVLVQGDSGAGKTRAAFEALRAALPAHRLFVPERSALVAAVEEMTGVRDAALWLDDLERYLGTGGLTTTAVSRVLSGSGHGRVIVATLRTQELHRLEADDNDRLGNEEIRKVLARARIVRLDKQFSADELRRARARAHDQRIAEALAHADEFGLAEYLAAGPQLLQRWQDGWSPGTHPRGAALVQSAVDCRLAGFLGPLPRALLIEAHAHYLAARGVRLRPEPLDKAWTWATTPWRDTTALLEESDTATVTVFDYLVDHVQRTTTADDHAPESIVRLAITHAGRADLDAIAEAEYAHGRYTLAAAADARGLGELTHELGAEHPDTLTCRNNLAVALRDQGELDQAADEHRAVLQILQRVLGAEHPNTLTSRNNLATALHDQRKLEQAADEHRAVLQIRQQVLGAEHPDTLNSRNNLALVLRDQGKLDQAADEHRAVLQIRQRVLGAEHPNTLNSHNNLVTALHDQGKADYDGQGH